MTWINEKLICSLESNSKSLYIGGISILLRLLDNIIREPENVKYRKIKLDNKIVKEKLLPINGICEVLEDIGFVQTNNELHLSPNTLIATVKKYRDFINQRLEYIQSNPPSQPTITDSLPSTSSIASQTDAGSITGTKRKISTHKSYLGQPYATKIGYRSVVSSSNADLKYLEHLSDSFMQYEDQKLQEYARTLIPLESLKSEAIEKIRQIQKAIVKEQKCLPEPLYDDVFLAGLLEWFNTKFFTWVDSIACKVCKKLKACEKTSTENGVRVEIINCCGTQTKFFRYNDVSLLLSTRRGRCGEYANCFTFLCRALGYDTRFVHGNFDHVWTEIYSHSQKRWIHYDPSENLFDAPLVYQHGWKRNINYVFAFSYDDIQDVTWRYTSNYKHTRLSRTKYKESELLHVLLLIRQKRQAKITQAREKFLLRRNLVELAAFLTPRQPTSDEKAGRSSGSLDWRLSRGEHSNKREFVFNANETQIALKQFNLRYSCARDLYEMFVGDSHEVLDTIKGWDSCIFESQNIFRKTETDWKMVYLARTEETNNARIVWKFDFSRTNLKISDIRYKISTKTYESGLIDIKFLNESNIYVSSVNVLQNSSKFSIVVEMSGGKGDIAWQHTQLFRQGFDCTEYPFELFIEFH